MNRTHVVAIISTVLLILPFLVAAGSCPSITHNLSLGSRGQDVQQLQLYLMDNQFLASTAWGGSQANAGYFGKLTQTAVMKWQASHGIVSSGIPSTTGYGAVGTKTRAAIAAACAKQSHGTY